tara:strand:- start:1697 stop:2329 length:633 start_codon:yes stop_codon:yes gene_type:complete
MIRIDIISDAVCPWCFIGKKRLEKAIDNFNSIKFDITWHPFQLNPEMPQKGVNRNLYLSSKFGGNKRANDVYNQIEIAGLSSGINFKFKKINIMPNSLYAHILIEYSKEFNIQNKITNELFKSFFINGENIGDTNVLNKIAKINNLENFNIKRLIDKTDIALRVKNSDIESRAKGVSGVPFFIINEIYAISGAQESEVFEKIFETCLIAN